MKKFILFLILCGLTKTPQIYCDTRGRDKEYENYSKQREAECLSYRLKRQAEECSYRHKREDENKTYRLVQKKMKELSPQERFQVNVIYPLALVILLLGINTYFA